MLDTQYIEWYNIKKYGGKKMFCKKCGYSIPDGAKFCEYCGWDQDKDSELAPGVKISENKHVSKKAEENATGYGFLGFLFPLIGIILGLAWKNDHPKKSENLIQGAIAGIIIGVVLGIIIGCIYASYIKQLFDNLTY